jgi:acetylornithine deacetylase/succinyl-diaminopimelate desuccinylase-like protein
MARVARLLRDLDRKRTPVHVTPVVRQMIESMAEALPRTTAAALRALLRPPLTDRALRLIGPQARALEPMLRNTVSATIVRGGDKINVVPSVVELELDGRALPGFGPEAFIAEVRALVGDDVELELVRHDPGPAEPDLGLFDSLAGIIRELDPEGIPVPFLQVGATDGRFFSALGIQTYGFLPLRLPADFQFAALLHAADERVPTDAIEFGAEAVYKALSVPR